MRRLAQREVVGRCIGSSGWQTKWAIDDWTTRVVSTGRQLFERLTMMPSKMLSYEQPLHFHFYGASIYEGSLGTPNSVRVSVCPSVCHMRGL